MKLFASFLNYLKKKGRLFSLERIWEQILSVNGNPIFGVLVRHPPVCKSYLPLQNGNKIFQLFPFMFKKKASYLELCLVMLSFINSNQSRLLMSYCVLCPFIHIYSMCLKCNRDNKKNIVW